MLVRCLITFFIIVLAACSNGDADGSSVVDANCGLDICDVTVGSTQQLQTSVTIAASTGALSGGIASAEFNPNTQIFTVTGSNLNAEMNRFSTADHFQMLAMRDATGVHNAYIGDGSGTKVAVYSGGLAGNVQHVASFGRIGATELPLVGSAQFNGDYAGFTPTRRVTGTAQLDVNFGSATISGQITNRFLRQKPDNAVDPLNPLSTLALGQASLGTDGNFSGVTTGGQIVNGQILWNPATGSFAGLIGGATGDEAVGTVTVTHTTPSGGSFEEIGGFLATR